MRKCQRIVALQTGTNPLIQYRLEKLTKLLLLFYKASAEHSNVLKCLLARVHLVLTRMLSAFLHNAIYIKYIFFFTLFQSVLNSVCD